MSDEERSTQRLRGADERTDLKKQKKKSKKKVVKAAELGAKRCLSMGNLVGHIQELIPVSQRAASAAGPGSTSNPAKHLGTVGLQTQARLQTPSVSYCR